MKSNVNKEKQINEAKEKLKLKNISFSKSKYESLFE